jgi:hypothetical protein
VPNACSDLQGAPSPIANKNPPNANNTRGQYIGVLLQQALKSDFSFPNANVPSYDLPQAKDQPFR